MANNKASLLTNRTIVEIQKDLSSGFFKPGEKILTEPELMTRYAVGRSTVREAIKMLSVEGILEVRQGAGTFVCKNRSAMDPLTRKIKRYDSGSVREVRNLLERETVRLACLNRTQADLESIENCLNRRKLAIEEGKYKACLNADLAFHFAIAEASGNALLAELYHSFSYVFENYIIQRDKEDIGHFSQSQDIHRQLFESLKLKNALKAQEIMVYIIDEKNDSL